MRPAIWPYKINHSSACGRCDLSNKSCLVSYQLTYPAEFPLSILFFASLGKALRISLLFPPKFLEFVKWNMASVETENRKIRLHAKTGNRIRRRYPIHNAFHCVFPSIIFPWLKTSGAIYTMLHYLGRINRLFDRKRGGEGGRLKKIWSGVEYRGWLMDFSVYLGFLKKKKIYILYRFYVSFFFFFL